MRGRRESRGTFAALTPASRGLNARSGPPVGSGARRDGRGGRGRIPAPRRRARVSFFAARASPSCAGVSTLGLSSLRWCGRSLPPGRAGRRRPPRSPQAPPRSVPPPVRMVSPLRSVMRPGDAHGARVYAHGGRVYGQPADGLGAGEHGWRPGAPDQATARRDRRPRICLHDLAGDTGDVHRHGFLPRRPIGQPHDLLPGGRSRYDPRGCPNSGLAGSDADRSGGRHHGRTDDHDPAPR